MVQHQSRTIVLMLCSLFIIGAKIAHSADVDDSWRQTLCEGIEARQSAIHSLRIKYTVVRELTEFADETAKRFWEESVRDGTRSQKEADQMLSRPVSGTKITKVELLMSDGKIATVSGDATPNSDGEPTHIVFDGEILTLLEGSDMGRRMRATLDVALRKPTIDSLSQVDGVPLQELFKLWQTTCTLLPPAAENGDIVFHVTASSSPTDEPEAAWTPRSEVIAEINATKSFWPERLVETYVSPTYGEPEARYILREVRFSDFKKAGSIDIPRKIEEIDSRLTNTTDESGDIGVACRVYQRTTLLVDDVAINEPVDAKEFVLNFPPGARYLDLDGDTKIVEPDGTIQNLSATLGKRGPVAEYASNKALPALDAMITQPAHAWVIGVWQWVALGATTLSLAGVFALYSVRYLRARRSAP